MQHMVDKNQAILDSFIKAIEELAILRDNLLKKEVSDSAPLGIMEYRLVHRGLFPIGCCV